MDRLIGIKILAVSFFVVAAGGVVLSVLFLSKPAEDSIYPAVGIAALLVALAIAAIGLGILEYRNAARWIAFAGLTLLASLALLCAFYDVAGMQRLTWTLVDMVLFLAFASPAVYLLMPGVGEEFAHRAHAHAKGQSKC